MAQLAALQETPRGPSSSRRFAPAFFNVLDPLQQASVVDSQEMDDVFTSEGRVERAPGTHPGVGRRNSPSTMPIRLGSYVPSIRQFNHSLQDALRRCLTAQSQASGKMLEQRGLAVARVPAQDDEVDAPFYDCAIQRLLQIGFNVGPCGEVSIEAACFAIAPP